MEACDVLIVGGGPAGSSCAWGLRRSGLAVAVLDKQTFPRDKVCGGWITPGVLNDLRIDAVEYARGRVFQPITSFRIGSIGGAAVDINYGAPVSYGIRRREFDEYLLWRSGARLLLGKGLEHLERSDGGWIANDRIRARVVVGAGGHFCPVARLTGAKGDGEPVVAAQETEFEMDAQQIVRCQVQGERPELYFCPDMKGYGWCFRKGNFLNIGLGRADSHGLRSQVDEFVSFLREAGRIAFDIPPLRGHAYILQGTSTRKITSDGMLLIGDAAGLAYAQSGEGIRPAIESGLLAAQSIIACNGVYEEREFERYRARIAAGQTPRLTRLGSRLPAPLIGLLARTLLQTRWFVRGVVLDQWFLHLNENAPQTL